MQNCRMYEPQSALSENLTDSRITSGLFSGYSGAPSTAYTEPLEEELLEAAVKSTEPRELSEALRDSQPVSTCFQPPSVNIHSQKPKSIQGFKAKYRKFFRRLREPRDH